MFIRHQESENSLFTKQNSPSNVWLSITIVEPLSKYSPVMLHLSPATGILNDKPCYIME